jgi:predicted kinase
MPPRKQPQDNCVIYVFFGMIATGKTLLSEAWAKHKKLNCYNSDRLRKELAGIDPTESRREAIDGGIYTKEFSRKTYKALLDKAETEVANGNSVVLDGSYQYAHDRQTISGLAKKINAQVYFILCQCSETEMKRRLMVREKDAAAVSDGRWEIYLKQKQRFEPPDEIPASRLIIIDTNAPVKNLLDQLRRKLP